MMDSRQKEWAQLVCSTDLDTPPIPIHDDNFTIGRTKACDLILDKNKVVSGKHCRLVRRIDGKTWLEDTSTNGTWVNQTKLTKGQKVLLNHGDEIFVVKRSGIQSVAYVFQETDKLEEEMMDATLEYDDEEEEESESTQDYECDTKSDKGKAQGTVSGGVKRDRSESSNEEQQDAKRLHTEEGDKEEKVEDTAKTSKQGESKDPSDQPEPAAINLSSRKSQVPGTSHDQSDSAKETKTQSKTDSKDAASSSQGKAADATSSEAKPGMSTAVYNHVCIPSVLPAIYHGWKCLQPCMHSFCAACYSSWMEMANSCPTCRIRVQRINKNHIVNNLVEAYLKENPDKKRSEDELKELDNKNKITRDMLIPKKGHGMGEYDYESDEDEPESPVSEDSSRSASPVVNFLGFGLAPQLILPPRPPRSICRQCPGFVPTANDPNIGTTVTLSPADQPVSTGSADATSSKVKDEAEDLSTKSPKDKPSTSTAKSDPEIPTAASSAKPTADSTKDTSDKPSTSTGASATCGSSPTGASSTSAAGNNGTHQVRITPSGDIVTMPTAPVYQCNYIGNHLLCMCCQRPMPDRRVGFGVPPNVPSQKCTICGRFYCHMYWGCQKIDCLGCLNKFKDMNFGDKCMRNFVNNNSFESEILKKYLQAKNKSWQDVLSDSLAKLDAGQYNCPDRQQHRVNSETPVCYTCGMKNFQELAYQYRKDIPRDQLPAEALSRSNCYWGKSCRTQFNKPQHAQRFNHICDQTRF